jgi:hypothetical protein
MSVTLGLKMVWSFSVIIGPTMASSEISDCRHLHECIKYATDCCYQSLFYAGRDEPSLHARADPGVDVS